MLVRIRPAEYQDKVRQASSEAEAAQAAAEKAKLDFERATRLYESKSLTKPEFDAAKAQYDSDPGTGKGRTCRRPVKPRSLCATRHFVAPFNGEIVKKSAELGAFVGPGVPVFVAREHRRCENRRWRAGHGRAVCQTQSTRCNFR